jgi:hypothetical protein
VNEQNEFRNGHLVAPIVRIVAPFDRARAEGFERRDRSDADHGPAVDHLIILSAPVIAHHRRQA